MESVEMNLIVGSVHTFARYIEWQEEDIKNKNIDRCSAEQNASHLFGPILTHIKKAIIIVEASTYTLPERDNLARVKYWISRLDVNEIGVKQLNEYNLENCKCAAHAFKRNVKKSGVIVWK